MDGDENGVLGNLPRSRPGTRSQKRSSAAGRPSEAASRAAEDAEERGAAAASPGGGGASTSAGRDRGSGGPLDDAVRAATKVAGTGLRVASGVTREVLRRLPRV
jgi:hypothetical protein